jgi:hypothetical protein
MPLIPGQLRETCVSLKDIKGLFSKIVGYSMPLLKVSELLQVKMRSSLDFIAACPPKICTWFVETTRLKRFRYWVLKNIVKN